MALLRKDDRTRVARRLTEVIRKDPDISTEALCARFGCGHTMVEDMRRRLREERK